MVSNAIYVPIQDTQTLLYYRSCNNKCMGTYKIGVDFHQAICYYN